MSESDPFDATALLNEVADKVRVSEVFLGQMKDADLADSRARAYLAAADPKQGMEAFMEALQMVEYGVIALTVSATMEAMRERGWLRGQE